MSGFVYIQYINLAQEPGYRCICSNRDRLSYYVEIQINFGTVWHMYGGAETAGTPEQFFPNGLGLRYYTVNNG